MKIGDQIKQNKFSSETEKAFVNISFTYNYINSRLSQVLKPHDISIQQFNVLRILKGQNPDPVSVNDITDRMIDKMSNASRLVEKLRKKGLVTRTPCSYDKRQVDVGITEKGLSLLLELNELVSEVISNHSHLDEQEFATLNTLLDAFRKD
jgi:DNA-binding MarR family transcriptional regulator